MTQPIGGDHRLAMTVAVALGAGAMIVHVAAGIALLAPTTLGLLGLLALVSGLLRWPDDPTARNRVMWWTIVAFAAHLVFGLAVANSSGIIRSYLAAPDAFTYHTAAVDLVRHWTAGFPAPSLPAGKEGFYYLLGALYWVFGTHPSAGLAVNAALAAALVPLVTDTTHRLFGRAAARYVGPLVVLLPGVFLWTSQLIKEAAVLFLIAVGVNCAVRLGQRFSPLYLLLLTLSVASLLSFRAWVGLVVAGGLLAGIAIAKREVVSGMGAGLSIIAVLGILVASLGLGYSGYKAATSSDLKQAHAVRQDLSTSNTGFDSGADISTPARALSYLPRGLLQFAFGPFPWQIRGARQLALVPDMFAGWFILPNLWWGLRAARPLRERRPLVLIPPALTTAILLSLTVGNYGTQLRERMQVLIILVPFVAVGLAQHAARRAFSADPENREPLGVT